MFDEASSQVTPAIGPFPFAAWSARRAVVRKEWRQGLRDAELGEPNDFHPMAMAELYPVLHWGGPRRGSADSDNNE